MAGRMYNYCSANSKERTGKGVDRWRRDETKSGEIPDSGVFAPSALVIGKVSGAVSLLRS